MLITGGKCMGPDAITETSKDRSAASAYSEVLYPSHPYAETHPNRLATMAVLFGSEPPPVESCRVLEIGCGDGSNLIPIAVGLPGSECVGIDLAPTPVETARSIITKLGVENVRCEIMDILDVGPDLGRFDYIIAHGFYSWVPPMVREKLLALCSDLLSANGIAFVSYNTYPAGHIREASRGIMRFHHNRTHGDHNTVKHRLEFLQFLDKSIAGDGLWKAIIHSEVQRLTARDVNAAYHDDLAAVCTSFYFTDFVESASHFGLQFLSEALLGDMIAPPVHPEVLQRIDEFAGNDLIATQQYLDFLLYRGFRRTLLCRRDLQLDRSNLSPALNRLAIASSLKKTGKHSAAGYEFSNQYGDGTYTTKNAVMLVTLAHLEAIWPYAEPFPIVLEHTIRNIDPSLRGIAEEGLAPNMLHLAAHSLVELRAYQPMLAQRVSALPVASPLARLQAKEGRTITTALHYELNIPEERVRWLIQMLDGSRDHRALIDELAARYRDFARTDGETQLGTMLAALHRMGVLVA
jgi:SAM-dependent methyltransferase